jgi:hypothetical protein
MCISLDFQSNVYITKMYETMNIKKKYMYFALRDNSSFFLRNSSFRGLWTCSKSVQGSFEFGASFPDEKDDRYSFDDHLQGTMFCPETHVLV